MMILGIESSCDESALAIFDETTGLRTEVVHSQIALHQEYGGVVPDLASREHLNKFAPLLGPIANDLVTSLRGVAVTCGPGLAGCLALGISLAKALAIAWRLPLVGVNHLRGHAYSPFIPLHANDPEVFESNFRERLPHLGLIVSGGNTLLFEIDTERQITLLAQTVDDAAGEALDKGAKLLGMAYPGGPLMEKQAEGGDRNRFDFPRAFPSAAEMKFSFSGLKTSLRYRLESMSDDDLKVQLPDICASYQEAVVDALVKKAQQALQKKHYASLGLSGGVANNQCLRSRFTQMAQKRDLPVLIAEPKHTGDNAAMIAFAAWVDAEHTIKDEQYDLSFHPSLPLA